VAVKRLRAELREKDDRVAMFLDDARLASRVIHPNVASTLDVIAHDGDLFIVTEYVEGASLRRLMSEAHARGTRIPLPIITAILGGVLRGLAATHSARDEAGASLGLVHRDMSPENVVVGIDGHARVIDFGVAKARARLQRTRTGQIKGKLDYLAPERIHGDATPASDVFAVGIIAWELLVGERPFVAPNDGALLAAILSARVETPSSRGIEVSPVLDTVVMRSLSRDPNRRWGTATEMAEALEAAVTPGSSSEVAQWTLELAASEVERCRGMIATLEAFEGPSIAHVAPVVERRPAPARIRMVLAALGGVATFAALALGTRAGSSTVRPTTASEPSSVTASLEPPPPVASLGPESSLSPASAPEGSTAAPVRRRHLHESPPESHNTPALSASLKARNCDMPYVFDKQGRKHFDPKCF
jgi:serine/threonine-protein kinase